MEDNITTTPQTDVVQVSANTSPENTTGYSAVIKPTVDPSQTQAIIADQQITPAPKTERELAYEAIDEMRSESYNQKGQSISNWIRNDYDYDATQAGTLWIAGKINDVNTQMSFLEATLNEDLYSEMDLQKYFFDTNLATARAYAKEKKHETAYGFYRAAEEKALAEAQLTGWYMPAEAGYMLSQWVLAEEKLKEEGLSQADYNRADSVKRAVSGWFEANNITERGIECLNHRYLQETIRHNREMERLQDDANEIQRKANEDNKNNTSASYGIQLRELQFNNAQLELKWGYDITGDGIIGHTGEDAQRFGYYTDQKDWAKNNLGQAFQLWGSDHARTILGEDYNDAYNSYMKNVQDNQWLEKQYSTGSDYINGDSIDKLTEIKIKNSELKEITDSHELIKDATIRIIRTDLGAQPFLSNTHSCAPKSVLIILIVASLISS